MTTLPTICIGLPVFNGGSKLYNALDSLLSLDYPNYRIVVSDNDSSDDTSSILKAYAAKNSHLELHCCPVGGVPSTENYNRVLRVSHGDYFMWASHNMLWDSSILRRCVESFQKHPNAVLVSPTCKILDGASGRPLKIDPCINTSDLDPIARVTRFLQSDLSTCALFYGLMRRQSASEVPLRIIFGTDHVFLAELSFKGEFITIPETLMSKYTGGTSTTWNTIAEAERITHRLKITYPWTAREYEMQKMIFCRSPINRKKRLLLSAISFFEFLKLTKAGRLATHFKNDLIHHVFPLLFRYSKPFGTRHPIILPNWLVRFGKISTHDPDK